jgi:hypothetical protein
MLKVVAGEAAGVETSRGIDEICRHGAERMLAVALESRSIRYIAQFTAELDELRHRLVVPTAVSQREVQRGADPLKGLCRSRDHAVRVAGLV